MTQTLVDLAECRRRIAKASPLPWFAIEGGVETEPVVNGRGVELAVFKTRKGSDAYFDDQSFNNSHFASYARTALPALASEVEWLRRALLKAMNDLKDEHGLDDYTEGVRASIEQSLAKIGSTQ
jgi:hypothetical protein